MATQMIRQTKFTNGQVDVINWKRTDLEGYMTCAQDLTNMEVGTTGLARKRKGTQNLLNITAYGDVFIQGYEFRDKFGGYYIVTARDMAMDIYSIDVNTGNLTHIQTVVTSYHARDLPVIDYGSNNDVIVFVHNEYKPSRLFISPAGYLTNPFTFTFEELTIYPQPAYDFGNIDYNNFTVLYSVLGNVLTFSFTGLGSDPGFTNAWVGGQILGPGNSVTQPIGYAIITAVSAFSLGTVTFTANIIIPFQAPFAVSNGSYYSVRQPVFTDELGYPGATTFYQNRLWFGDTPALNSTVFGSKLNKPLNFDVGTGLDTDAIIYDIGITNSGAIEFLNSGKQLEIYTQNVECAAPQDPNVGLTPSTFSIRQQSAYGNNGNVKPVTYLNDSYYISKSGNAIMNYHFNGIGQTYSSSNVSVQASSLVNNPVNRALLRGTDSSQDNFVYWLNQDNKTITSFQFSEEYKFAALTPITFNSILRPNNIVEIKDLFTVNNTVYMLKFYTNTEVYTIEKFADDVFMDGWIVKSANNDGLVTGLSDLEGYTVQITYDNGQGPQDFGSYTVVDGEITIDGWIGGTHNVVVGLLYDCTVVPMYIFAGPMNANIYKKITRIYVDYFESLNFNVNNILVPYQTFANVQQGLPPQPQTGSIVVNPVFGWNRDKTFSITQSSPFDLQITAIGYQVTATMI